MRRKEEREMENLWKTVTENVGFIVVIAITAAVLFAVAKLGEMWAGVTSSQQMRTKKIVTIGMMSALAFILQIFDFQWTQRGMIPRPSDYESAALTD